jgi:hypothetical protein
MASSGAIDSGVKSCNPELEAISTCFFVTTKAAADSGVVHPKGCAPVETGAEKNLVKWRYIRFTGYSRSVIIIRYYD